jgi:hypothetical protein
VSRRSGHRFADEDTPLRVGLQIVAPRFEEPPTLRVANLVEEVNPVAWPTTAFDLVQFDQPLVNTDPGRSPAHWRPGSTHCRSGRHNSLRARPWGHSQSRRRHAETLRASNRHDARERYRR